jgi:hypothetical protein
MEVASHSNFDIRQIFGRYWIEDTVIYSLAENNYSILRALANAETIAAESSAAPFEARYFDGTTQVLLLGGGCGEEPEISLVARTKKGSRGMTTIILNVWELMGNYRNGFLKLVWSLM